MDKLHEAIEAIKKHGCHASEASKITDFSTRHLLRMAKRKDPRLKAYSLGREVIFDVTSLQELKENRLKMAS